MSPKKQGIENARNKDARGQFGRNSARAKPTENSNVLDLGDGVKATFRQAKNHAKRATQGTWSVNISTPRGSQEFSDLNVLDTRINQLHERGFEDMAEKFETVFDELKARNARAAHSPSAKTKATVAA